MLRQLLHRPIAVSMTLIAISALGILSLSYLPVSLMPEIDVPRITVQITSPGASVNEIEQQMVTPMRYQLSQVAGLKDIETLSRMDAGIITLTFDPGSDMDLLFIDVNEKIDRAMNAMPKDMGRPKVVKASAMDIPAFYIDISDKNAIDDNDIAQLSRLTRNVIVKRIEQLPQTAMVDFSGTAGTEIDVTPDMDKMQSLGITNDDIQKAISDNNIVLEALSVASGIYRYSIHFDSQILTKEDIANIYIRHDGRMLQLKDLCEISEKPTVRNGIVRHNGRNAITIAVIKQNDAQMADLQKSISQLIGEMQKDYPNLQFDISRDQTELLDYSISNLELNLAIGAVLACLILFLFNGGWRTPLLIIISIPLSLILTMLCFYVMGITLNIISLSGLILGVGMIVDNSIIVIDNIRQRGDAVSGTREVFMPMLSSVLTTCSVFLPLIFLSGTAGALFYDQAVGVAIALFASLAVASIAVPVYYFALYKHKDFKPESSKAEQRLTAAYEPVMGWTLRHARLGIGFFVLCLLFIIAVFPAIRKERMPYLEHDDAMMSIDWNSGISAKENDRRVQELLSTGKGSLETTTSMCGVQEFLLSHTRDVTSSEAMVYMKARNQDGLDSIKTAFTSYLQEKYPEAKVEYGISGNIYDLIFQTDEPDLEIHLQRSEGGRPSVSQARAFTDSLRRAFPRLDIQPVATETTIRCVANPEQMAFYGISYSQLYNRLKALTGNNKVYEIASGDQSVPVVITQNPSSAGDLMQNTIRSDEGVDIPLEYLMTESKEEQFKRLAASNEGEYYPITIRSASDKETARVIDYCQSLHTRKMQDVKPSFHGSYFDSRQLIRELFLVLVVALLLLYFILAAQFESLLQPAIILAEIVIDISIVLLALWAMGESINTMSMIGLVVMSGIVINDSILKVDTINHVYRSSLSLSTAADGSSYKLLRAILIAGKRRLKPIVMTTLTTILALLPFLNRSSMGAALQFPLSLTLVIGMLAGTVVSLFFVPMLYFLIYRAREKRMFNRANSNKKS